MAHWPTIAASATLAAFVVAGALIHAGSTPGASGMTIAAIDAADLPVGGHWQPERATAKSAGDRGGRLDGQASPAHDASRRHGHIISPAGLPEGIAAATATHRPAHAAGMAGASDPAEESQLAQSLAATVSGAGIGLPEPVHVAPLPPLPPQTPAPPAVRSNERRHAPPAPPVPSMVDPLAAGVAARMAVVMPLSIPELGPLDPARVGEAARELAEVVHGLANEANNRAVAAEQSARGALRKQDGCDSEAGQRPASFLSNSCSKAGL